MNSRQLVLRNLQYYWRTNLAVIAGVIAATAVIGGALVVGDSVRESLRQMSLDRLGKIDHAVHGPRFFTEDLSESLLLSPSLNMVAPALILQGTLEFQVDSDAELVNRVGQVNLFGVDDRAWDLVETGEISTPELGQVVLNRGVASQLGVAVNDEVTLVVEIPTTIPRDSLLGEKEESITALPLTVAAISEDELGVSRLGLNPSQQLPANAFVNLDELQTAIGLQEVPRSRQNPIRKPARVNTLFLSTMASKGIDGQLSKEFAERLTGTLQSFLTMDDLALRLVENEDRGYLSLESEQMFLEQSISNAAQQVTKGMVLNESPVLVYLFNEIWKEGTPEKFSMYSVVAGIEPELDGRFGPFDFIDSHEPLSGDSVYLNELVAKQIEANVGDRVHVKYYAVGDRGELPELTREFCVAGIVKMEGPAADPGFTPNVPGVTDAETYDEWREPFPMDRDRIPQPDKDFWEDHKTTPKMFTSLETAQEVWASRYGNLTSIRIAPHDGQSLSELKEEFRQNLLQAVDANKLGLAVQPVKMIGLAASKGATDFTGLFIGFSFFIILSATMLVGLLFRLGVDQRMSEVGLLSAVGLTQREVRRNFLFEGGLLVVIGGVLGLGAAIGYAWLMIYGLKTWWYGAIGTKFLFLSVSPVSLLIGFCIAVIVAMAAVWWALRQTKGHSIRELMSGNLSQQSAETRPWLARWTATICLIGSGILLLLTLIGAIPEQEAFFGFSWKVVLFFAVGMGLLVGTLALIATLLGSRDRLSVRGKGSRAEARFSFRNASRNRTRSVLTASLIACATFLIVAVGAGQQNPTQEQPDRRSGNGGFSLVGETNVPVLYDLNTVSGRADAGFDDPETDLGNATVYPFRVRPGENASCLNLYQTQLPTVLGVPDDVLDSMIEENRFLFANTPGEHPWELLRTELPNGNVPVLGDMNTLMYSLHKNIGQTIPVSDASAEDDLLEVRGMFANSVFQGVLLMSEANFMRLFPEQSGFRYFLIDVPLEESDAVAQRLESELGDYGFDAELVSRRLANFLAVQNTYLSTFQTLGGLGLLLGTLGMATVMLRNVFERRGEFALLRSIGYRKSQIARIVIWENALLLLGGLLAGTLSALLAMSPHLLSSVADVPWTSLAITLLGVSIVGLLAAIGAVRAALRTPILSTLRGD